MTAPESRLHPSGAVRVVFLVAGSACLVLGIASLPSRRTGTGR